MNVELEGIILRMDPESVESDRLEYVFSA